MTEQDELDAMSGLANVPSPAPDDVVFWVSQDGKENVRVASEGLKSEPFHLARQARTAAAYPGRRNYEGLHWFSSTAEHIWHESLFEATALMCWDYRGDVAGVAAQPMRLVFGSGATHFPDFFLLLESGEQVLCDVRPAARIDDATGVQFSETARLCASVGWRYELFTEIDPIRQSNLEWLAAYRHKRFRPADYTRDRIFDLLEMPQPLGSIAKALLPTNTPRALPWIYHMMWMRQIDFAVSKVLNLSTLVWASDS